MTLFEILKVLLIFGPQRSLLGARKAAIGKVRSGDTSMQDYREGRDMYYYDHRRSQGRGRLPEYDRGGRKSAMLGLRHEPSSSWERAIGLRRSSTDFYQDDPYYKTGGGLKEVMGLRPAPVKKKHVQFVDANEEIPPAMYYDEGYDDYQEYRDSYRHTRRTRQKPPKWKSITLTNLWEETEKALFSFPLQFYDAVEDEAEYLQDYVDGNDVVAKMCAFPTFVIQSACYDIDQLETKQFVTETSRETSKILRKTSRDASKILEETHRDVNESIEVMYNAYAAPDEREEPEGDFPMSFYFEEPEPVENVTKQQEKNVIDTRRSKSKQKKKAKSVAPSKRSRKSKTDSEESSFF